MNEVYAVPKRKIAAELWSPDGGEEVRLFAAEHAQSHDGLERPSDLLNGPGDFLPIETRSGDIALVHRLSLWVVRVGSRGEDGTRSGVGSGQTSTQISVVLEDGSLIQAHARYQLPEDHARLFDFLNASGDFVPLWDEQDLLLINKRRIRCVIPR